jgi:hypothetical protein
MLIFGIIIFMFVIRKPGGQIKHLLISYLSNAIFKVDFIKKFFYPREKEKDVAALVESISSTTRSNMIEPVFQLDGTLQSLV